MLTRRQTVFRKPPLWPFLPPASPGSEHCSAGARRIPRPDLVGRRAKRAAPLSPSAWRGLGGGFCKHIECEKRTFIRPDLSKPPEFALQCNEIERTLKSFTSTGWSGTGIYR